MTSNNSLVLIAVLAVLVSALGAVFTYNTLYDLRQSILTGYVTGNLTVYVESSVAINFTNFTVDFGSGRVNSGANSATLNTTGGGSVAGGNWTLNTTRPGSGAGLVLENVGNNNVSVNFSSGTDAATMIGGTSPDYQFNVSQLEAGSCTNLTGGTAVMNNSFALGLFAPFNTTQVRICDRLQSGNSADSLRIELLLVIPSNSKTGVLNDTPTAIAYAQIG